MESEKAKAKAGKLYDANNDIELVSEREACKEVCYELNSLRPSQTFGDNVFVAPNCGFYTAGHALDAEQRILGLEYAYPITIGNNVWIGAQVCVLPGVTIGDNTIIGAGSVVTKSIPANVLAVGNPCRVLRTITEADRAKYISE